MPHPIDPIPLAAVRTDPHWPLPSVERLQLARPAPRMQESFAQLHRGLVALRIHVLRLRSRHGDVAGTKLQEIFLPRTPPGGTPEISADTLCRLVWLRGEQYARQHNKQTQFRVYFDSLDSEQQTNTEQVRFMIKLRNLLADDEAEDESDPNDVEAQAESEVDAEDGESEEGEDEGDDDDDEDDDDEYEDEDDDEYDSNQALVPMKERIDPSGERHIIPQQINPAFFTQIIGQSFKLAGKAYRGPMRETRIAAKSIRIQAIAMIKANQELAEMVIKRQIELEGRAAARQDKLIEHLHERMEMLESVVQKTTDLSVRLYDNFKELAREGWQAFHDAMKMKDEVVNDRIDWARWLVEDNERRQPPPPPPAPVQKEGGIGQLIRELSEAPMALGLLTTVLRRTGNDRDADMFEKMAINLSRAGRRGDEDGDDGEEDEEPFDVEAHETQHAPNGNGHARTAAPLGPFGRRIRAFRATLSPAHLSKLEEILPATAWAAFEAACTNTDDRAVLASLVAMQSGLDDIKVQMQIAQALTGPQITEIQAIVKAVKAATTPREPPARPRPSP